MVTRSLSATLVLTHGLSPVRLIRFGPKNRLVTADVDMQVVTWEGSEKVSQFDMRSSTQRHRALDRLRSAAFTIDGSGLYLCSGSRLLLKDVETGVDLWKYSAPEWWPFLIASPQCVRLTEDGGIVASFDNGTIERFTANHERVFRVKDSETPMWFELDQGASKMIGCDGYHVCVWSLRDGSRIQRLTLDEHAFAFEYSPSSGLAAIRDAGRLIVRSLLDGSVVDRVDLPPGPPVMQFTPDGQSLAYACGQTIVVRDEGGDSTVIGLEGTGRLVTLTFDQDGRLWTGHADGQVCQWALP